MSIGTAKPSNAELAQVKHYFINSLSIQEDYSAGDFENDALELLDSLFQHHELIVMVGGSGLFINAVYYGLDNLPKALPGVRDRLNQRYEREGIAALQRELEHSDPLYYQEVDICNPQRIIRALEVIESTGKPFSYFRKDTKKKRPFSFLKVGLDMDRQKLYQRINDRVDDMVAEGLVDEVRQLLPFHNRPPLRTVGYTELFDHLDGKIELSNAIERIKQNTRQFAKRQLTWFKKDPDTDWFLPDQHEDIIAAIIKKLHQY